MVYYKIDMQKSIESAKKLDPSLFANSDELASWAKIAANPAKAKGWLVHMLEALFLGKHNLDHMNIEHQLKGEFSGFGEFWFPYNISNSNLDKIGEIFRSVLPGFEIIVLHGGRTSNRKVEKEVRDRLGRLRKRKNNTNVLILSAQVGIRSFSVPEICEVYHAYDEGSLAVYKQRDARALTPDRNNPKKIGRSFSLSFDPNRDDKFPAMILELAESLKNKKGLSFDNAVREVLRTISFNLTDDGGPIRWTIDNWWKSALKNGSIHRVVGRCAQVEKMPLSLVEAVYRATGAKKSSTVKNQDVAERGRTYGPNGKNRKATTRNHNQTQKMYAAVRTTIKELVGNIRFIMLYGKPGDTLEECFAAIAKMPLKERKWLSTSKDGFAMDWKLVRELLLRKEINHTLIEWEMSGHNV